jgi:hypothetical protein
LAWFWGWLAIRRRLANRMWNRSFERWTDWNCFSRRMKGWQRRIIRPRVANQRW